MASWVNVSISKRFQRPEAQGLSRQPCRRANSICAKRRSSLLHPHNARASLQDCSPTIQDRWFCKSRSRRCKAAPTLPLSMPQWNWIASVLRRTPTTAGLTGRQLPSPNTCSETPTQLSRAQLPNSRLPGSRWREMRGNGADLRRGSGLRDLKSRAHCCR